MQPHTRHTGEVRFGHWRTLVSVGVMALLLLVSLGIALHHHGGTSNERTCSLCRVSHTPILIEVNATFVISPIRLVPDIIRDFDVLPLDRSLVRMSPRAPPA